MPLNNPGPLTVAETGLSLSDVTTGNATAAAHGLLPKLSGRVGEMFGGDGLWGPPNSSQRGLFLSNDCLNAGSSGAKEWFGAAISGGNITTGVKDTEHPGLWAYQCAASAANSGYQHRCGTFLLGGGEQAEFVFDFAVTANTLAYLGFHNSTTVAAPTKGVWLDFNGTTVTGKTAGTATQTTGTSFTIVQGSWYRGVVSVASDRSSVAFYLYSSQTGGTLLWSDTCAVTANIPATTDSVQHCSLVCNTLSQAQTILFYLDYMSLYVPRVLGR